MNGQGERILGLEVVALETAKQLDKSLAIIKLVEALPDKWAVGEKFDNEDQIEARRDCSDELESIIHPPQKPKV